MDAASNQASRPVESLDLSAFVRGLAHEVANPLNAIAMNCELLKMMADRGQFERVQEAVDRILTACARSGGMMRGLQRFGSALRAQPASPVELRELVDAAIRALALEYPGTLPQVSVEAAALQVIVDRVAVERALAALLRNASEAGSTRVEVSAFRDGAEAIVDMRDDGGGFVREDSDKFEAPFYSTHRTPANMGLGLTLARELLRANRGTLRIMPSERGAHLQVRLPIAEETTAPSGC